MKTKYTMTTAEAAAALGVTRDRVLKLTRAGRLDGEKVARDWRLDPASVARFVPMPQGWQAGRKRGAKLRAG